MYHNRLRAPLSISFLHLLLLLLVADPKRVAAFLYSGVSREISRLTYGSSIGSIPVVLNRTTVIFTDYWPNEVYFFEPEASLQGLVSMASFFSFQDNPPPEADNMLASCLDPDANLTYVITCSGMLQIERDGHMAVLASFPFYAAIPQAQVYCLQNSVVVVHGSSVYYWNTDVQSLSNLTLPLFAADATVSSALSANGSQLTAFFFNPSNGPTVSFFTVDITAGLRLKRSGVLFQNVTYWSTAAFSVFANDSLIAVPLLYPSESSNGSCSMDILLFDSYTSVSWIVPSLSQINWNWCNATLQALPIPLDSYLFPEDSATAIVSSKSDFLVENQVLSIYLNRETLFAQEASFFVESKYRTIFLLGFSSAETYQTTGCSDENGVAACFLQLYTVLPVLNGTATKRSIIYLPSTEYNFRSAINTGTDLAYGLSIRASSDFMALNAEKSIDIVRLNLSSDFSEPVNSVSFSFGSTGGVVDEEVTAFELMLDGTLLFATFCRAVIFDPLSLKVLRDVPSQAESCQMHYNFDASASATDRNGTVYLLDFDTVLLLQKCNIFNGSCLQSPVPLNLTNPVDFASPNMLLTNDLLYIVYYSDFMILRADTLETIYHYSNSSVIGEGGYHAFSSPDPYPNDIFALRLVTLSNNAHAVLFIRFSWQSMTQISSMRWFPADVDCEPVQVVISSNSSEFYVMFSSGMLAKAALPDGVLLDTIQVPLPSSDSEFTSVLQDSSSTLHLTLGDSLLMVYQNCPTGMYRNVTSGECASCPLNSISSAQYNQLCLSCPPRTAAEVSLNLCLCAPTYFSFSNDSDCHHCPSGALCNGSNTIFPNPGYWQGKNASFYLCPFPAGCIQTGCAKGYHGVICGQCAEGFGRVPAGCAECRPHQWRYTVPIIAGGFLVLILLLLLLWFDTREETEQFFGIIKTALSFVQVLGFPSGNNRLPLFSNASLQRMYSHFASVMSSVGLRVFSLASLDCLLRKQIPLYYVEMITVGFVPLTCTSLILLMSYLFRSPVSSPQSSPLPSRRHQERPKAPERKRPYYIAEELRSPSADEEVRNESDSSTPLLYSTEEEQTSAPPPHDTRLGAPIRLVLFIFLLVFPYVSTLLVQFFQCQNVDGAYYLVADYSSLCFDPQWKKMFAVELLLTLIYPIGGPIAILFLLKYQRHELNLRFLTAQFKSEYYYWDVVEMLRKFAMLLSMVIDQYQQQSDLSWFSGLPLTVAVVGLVLHIQVRPYRRRSQHHLQTAELIGVCLVNLLPAVAPVDSSNKYRFVMSLAVVIFSIGFTIGSIIFALWTARHTIKRVFNQKKT